MKKTKNNDKNKKVNLPDWLDETRNSLEHIATTAELIQGYAEVEWMKAGIVAHAGKMIASESEKLAGLIRKFEK